MVENLIQQFEIEKDRDQYYDGIEKFYYVSRDNHILALGKKVIKNERGKSIVYEDSFSYAFNFEFNKENCDTVHSLIIEQESNPTFYKTWWLKEDQYFLEHPYKRGYCALKAPSICSDHNYANTIKWCVEDVKNQLSIINVPSFKQTLEEWLHSLPCEASRDTHVQYEDKKTHKYLGFIDKFDFLLLSDDEDLRNLYLQYCRTCENYWSSYMSIVR